MELPPSTSWRYVTNITQNNYFHAFVGNNPNHRSLWAVDDLVHGCPRPRTTVHQVVHSTSGRQFYFCPRRHELVVYCRRQLQNSPLENVATMSHLVPFCIMLESEKKQTFLYRDLSLINAWCCGADVNIISPRLRCCELIFRNLPSNPMRQ